MTNVEEYVKKKRWEYKPAPGDELNIKVCPICGDPDWHFYWNVKTGMYYCQHGECNAGGSYYTLLRHCGDLYPVRQIVDTDEEEESQKEALKQELEALLQAHREVWKNEKAIAFFRSRRITPETVKNFKIGVKQDEWGTWWMSFPYLNDEGELRNCKYRTLGKRRRFKRLIGGESILYNEKYVKAPTKPYILITEGETDLLTAYSKGIDWIVGVTVGAKGIKSKWIDQLDRFGTIFICFDSDLAGEKGSHTLAKRLGYERCRQVVLPIGCKDLCEYFSQGNTKEDFLNLLRKARPFEVEGVVPVKDAIRKIAEEFRLRGTLDTGIHLPWEDVDDQMGGLLGGDLVVISGIPGVGKTSFALNVAYDWVLNEGLFSLSMLIGGWISRR